MTPTRTARLISELNRIKAISHPLSVNIPSMGTIVVFIPPTTEANPGKRYRKSETQSKVAPVTRLLGGIQLLAIQEFHPDLLRRPLHHEFSLHRNRLFCVGNAPISRSGPFCGQTGVLRQRSNVEPLKQLHRDGAL